MINIMAGSQGVIDQLTTDPNEAFVPDGSFNSVNSAGSDVNSLGGLDRESLILYLNQIAQGNVEDSWEAQKRLLDYSNDLSNAESARAWQRWLDADSTKYQRAIADMKEAGINPVIALGNGMPSVTTASSPALAGSQASVNAASAYGANAIGQKEQMVKEYIGMVASMVETGITAAGSLVGDLLPFITPIAGTTKVVKGFVG